ncbi:MAG: ABC transporter ATP-binding protein [Candidatus Atribacteria bacterium]|nr:MAG: ABC transporter ATP-binding protein [Candidatus Atribacteria bacterium]
MILETKDIVKRFGGLVAVRNVSMHVKKGEIFGIIGPNGAGKTTLLNSISGIYKPEEGRVFFKGENITAWKAHVLCKKGIARTFQIVCSFPRMTVLENVKVGSIFGSNIPQDDDERARELLDFVGFPLPIDTLAGNLNTVQLKYLELARALATNGELLLLDEIAAGLTPSELVEFIELIKKIRDTGITVITIEHVMKFIMTICDRIIVLNYGEKIAEGTPDEIVKNKLVLEAYLGKEHKVYAE